MSLIHTSLLVVEIIGNTNLSCRLTTEGFRPMWKGRHRAFATIVNDTDSTYCLQNGKVQVGGKGLTAVLFEFS